MPALPLTPAQLADARRLRSLYEDWKVRRRTSGESASQELAASLLGFSSQSSVSQYVNGKIPLNVNALVKFSSLFGCPPEDISADLAKEIRRIAEASTDGAVPKADWPFPEVPEHEIRALPPAQLSALQDALSRALAYLRPGIKASVPIIAAKPARQIRSGLTDMNAAPDELPMRIVGLPPAPWDGGKATYQSEHDSRIRISTQTGVVANVGPGEPHAANDKFEKVPEMADVRLAAGDGIENHAEEQTGMIQFRRSFLREVGADGGKARVVYAKGDSMEPVIRDGAALLFVANEELTLRDLAGGGVYAINYDGKMIVKTVTRDKLTKRWVARSFNPAYPDIPLENGLPVRVLGQVVWAGARLGDDEAGQWVRA